MTSFRQIEANRRNARKSTGPNTQEGKQRSRCNAVRHRLTAETVIGAICLPGSIPITLWSVLIVAAQSTNGKLLCRARVSV